MCIFYKVAVICQFMDETDYATAFKSLQEKNAHDAMDTYYEFMWDVTLLEYLVSIFLSQNCQFNPYNAELFSKKHGDQRFFSI